MHRIRRRLVQGLVGTGLSASLPLFNVASAQSSTIKIGHIDTLTGVRAAFGEATPWVIGKVRALVKDGLQVGNKKYAVEILSRDSLSDPNRVASLGTELVIREGVDLLLLGDGLSAPANELSDARGVPAINTMIQWEPFYQARGSGPDKGYPWSFLFFWSGSEVIANFFQMWNSIPTNKVIGDFFVDNEFGQTVSQGLAQAITKNGYTEVKGGLFRAETDDFSNQVSLFKIGKADILTGLAFPPHFTTFWGQALQAGYRPEICTMLAAFLFPAGVNALRDKGDGMSTEIWWTPAWPSKSSLTGQTARQVADDWEASTGKQWTQPLGYNHALWEVGIAALKSSGDPKNPEAVRNAIRTMDLQTLIGRVNFKDSKLKNVAATQLAAGQWRKTKPGSKFAYNLLITHNGTAPTVPVEAKLLPLSKLT